MTSGRWVVAALSAALLVPACASASEAPAPPRGAAPMEAAPGIVPVSPAEAPAPAPAVRRPATAFEADVMAVLERERVRLAALEAERAAAVEPARVLEVQRRIERLKQDTEIALLRVQVSHARRSGRLALAARLEAAIAELTQPRPPAVPSSRPAPVRDGAAP